MITRALEDIRQSYNEVADLCRSSEEPVYLTKNGVRDLVVMDVDSFEKRDKMLDLREKLLISEEDRAAGRSNLSLGSLDEAMGSAIEKAGKK